ncbi:MAG TPA: hypothetical protein VF790_13580 [Dissulfurispiraceae bacterium]
MANEMKMRSVRAYPAMAYKVKGFFIFGDKSPYYTYSTAAGKSLGEVSGHL